MCYIWLVHNVLYLISIQLFIFPKIKGRTGKIMIYVEEDIVTYFSCVEVSKSASDNELYLKSTVWYIILYIFQKQPPEVFYNEAVLKKVHNIHMKTPELESVFNKVAG